MEIDLTYKPEQVKALAGLHKSASKPIRGFDSELKKAAQTYIDEMLRDIKAFKRAMNKNDFPMIRHAGYGLQMNSNWIVELIQKAE